MNIKHKHFAVFIFCGSVLPAVAAPPSGPVSSTTTTPSLTLQECFALARDASETLKIRKEIEEQTEETYRRLRSNVLPDVRAHFSRIYQDTSGVAQSGGGAFTQRYR